jgi:hypothetical protein
VVDLVAAAIRTDYHHGYPPDVPRVDLAVLREWLERGRCARQKCESPACWSFDTFTGFVRV